MDPTVVSMLLIQINDKEDMEEIAENLHVRDMEWIFIPITDRIGSFETCTTHWSLLLWNSKEKSFIHLDSCGTLNSPASSYTAMKVSQLLDK
jgi:hypothetical protein